MIKSMFARNILAAAATHITVEVDLVTKAGISVRAAVPSDASTGIDKPAVARWRQSRRLGESHQPIEVANTVLASALGGADVSVQGALDANRCELDGVQIVQTWCQTQSLVCPSPPPRLRPGLRAFRCASPSATWPAT